MNMCCWRRISEEVLLQHVAENKYTYTFVIYRSGQHTLHLCGGLLIELQL